MVVLLFGSTCTEEMKLIAFGWKGRRKGERVAEGGREERREEEGLDGREERKGWERGEE